jgi:hypothetical protein
VKLSTLPRVEKAFCLLLTDGESALTALTSDDESLGTHLAYQSSSRLVPTPPCLPHDEVLKLISRRTTFSNHDKSRCEHRLQLKKELHEMRFRKRLLMRLTALFMMFSSSVDERYVPLLSCSSCARQDGDDSKVNM